MFKAMKNNRLGHLPGFNFSEFVSFEKEVFFEKTEYKLKAFWGKFDKYPLGEINNLGSYQEVDSQEKEEGYPILVIHKNGREFGFAFHEGRWMYWNNNMSRDSVGIQLRNPDFLKFLKQETGFDFNVFSEWNDFFFNHSFTKSDKQISGYGRVWILDKIHAKDETDYVFCWAWDPRAIQEKSKATGVLKIIMPVELSSGCYIHPDVWDPFIRESFNDTANDWPYLLNEKSLDKTLPSGEVSGVKKFRKEGITYLDQKLIFGIQIISEKQKISTKIESKFKASDAHTTGNIELKVELSDGHNLAMENFSHYLKCLLSQFIEIQISDKPITLRYEGGSK